MVGMEILYGLHLRTRPIPPCSPQLSYTPPHPPIPPQHTHTPSGSKWKRQTSLPTRKLWLGQSHVSWRRGETWPLEGGKADRTRISFRSQGHPTHHCLSLPFPPLSPNFLKSSLLDSPPGPWQPIPRLNRFDGLRAALTLLGFLLPPRIFWTSCFCMSCTYQCVCRGEVLRVQADPPATLMSGESPRKGNPPWVGPEWTAQASPRWLATCQEGECCKVHHTGALRRVSHSAPA